MVMEFALNQSNTVLSRNGYSIEEEEELFARSLQDVIDNPRWYLDHLEVLPGFFVSWKNYRKGYQITMPRNYEQ
jgi:hypothetical protein